MRILRMLPLFLILTAAVSTAQSTVATTESGNSYIQPDDIDFKALLKPPPAEGSDQTRQEIDVLLALQNSRTDADIKRAKSEAHLTPFIFSEVLGSWFNPDDLPTTATFLVKVMKESGAVGSYSAFQDAMSDWQEALTNWRCKLSANERRNFGAPAGWNCKDVKFFVGRISFDQLGPDRSAALNAVETRLKLPPDQVDLLISAGRDALKANKVFREFLNAGPRLRPPPRLGWLACGAGCGCGATFGAGCCGRFWAGASLQVPRLPKSLPFGQDCAEAGAVTSGPWLTALTVIVAVVVGPPSPVVVVLVDACAVKLPVAVELVVGVNFSPAKTLADSASDFSTKASASVLAVSPSLARKLLITQFATAFGFFDCFAIGSK